MEINRRNKFKIYSCISFNLLDKKFFIIVGTNHSKSTKQYILRFSYSKMRLSHIKWNFLKISKITKVSVTFKIKKMGLKYLIFWLLFFAKIIFNYYFVFKKWIQAINEHIRFSDSNLQQNECQNLLPMESLQQNLNVNINFY